MFVAHYDCTMRHAIPVEDHGICLPGSRVEREKARQRSEMARSLRQNVKRLVQGRDRNAEIRALLERANERHPLPPTAGLSSRAIIAEIARKHGLRSRDILSPSRVHPVVAARQEAIEEVFVAFLRAGRRLTLPELGRMFGRNHTTILFALRKRGIMPSPCGL